MSSVSSSSSTKSALRITGMASGLDVDSTVKALMTSYNSKLEKMKQQRQLVQWRQDSYRDIITDIKSMKSTYFDQLNREKYLLSSSSYADYKITATDSVNSTGTTSANVTANASATAGQYLIHVDQLAAAPTITVNSPTYSSSTKLTDLGSGYSSGVVSLTLSYNSTTSETNKVITIDNTSGAKTVGDLVSAINSQSSGSVVASFSELTGKFTIKTATTGTTSSISITAGSSNTAGTSDLASDLGIKMAGIGAQNAKVTIAPPGVTAIGSGTPVEKTSNTFTVDGVTYNLNRVDAAGQYTTLGVSKDTTATFDKIKGFIDKYNEFVDKIQKKIEEKKSLDYQPLTDTQKEEMTEEQITAWETKAKAGVLRSDSTLENMLLEMRRSFFDKVEAAGISLSEVGLSTSQDTTERGKIILTQDSTGEYKLKNAIKNNGAALVSIFTNQSSTPYSVNNTLVQRSTRYNENGIFQRINDIMTAYTTTTLDSNNHRGVLVERAGIKGTVSEYSNSIYNDLKSRDKAINAMLDKISTKETQLYKQFSNLETYMNRMNSQSSWLSQQLSG